MEHTLNIGILGLGVMGRSLALNFERNGYSVAGYDIHLNFDQAIFKDKDIRIFESLEELVTSLDRPRCILLMVPAGKPVDKAIASIKGNLEKNDVIIDGGNSFFLDTERRVKSLGREKIRFIGMGVSGGESGALWGPTLMPGGVESAWGSKAYAGVHRGQSGGRGSVRGMDGKRRRGALRQDGT